MTILDVQAGERDGFAHVVLRGELDLSTVPKVDEVLRRIEESRPPLIVLDLSGLSFLDPGVFIRSMATRGSLGGLSEAALQAALLMDASGKDDVLLETVGVGQAEVDVIGHADTVVLVLMPGSGDSVQALKAGVMEIPDVIVVNKSDHPLTETMVREIRATIALAPQEGWQVPIVQTEASKGTGIDELVEKMAEHREHIKAEGTLEERRGRNLRNEVLTLASGRMRRRLEESTREDPEVQELLDEVVARRIDPASAAGKLLERETDA